MKSGAKYVATSFVSENDLESWCYQVCWGAAVLFGLGCLMIFHFIPGSRVFLAIASICNLIHVPTETTSAEKVWLATDVIVILACALHMWQITKTGFASCDEKLDNVQRIRPVIAEMKSTKQRVKWLQIKVLLSHIIFLFVYYLVYDWDVWICAQCYRIYDGLYGLASSSYQEWKRKTTFARNDSKGPEKV